MTKINEPFLYENGKNTEAQKVVIVLPEIFGITKGMRQIVDRLADECGVIALGLDYYYAITQESTDLDHKTQMSRALELMEEMTGNDFMRIFDQALDSIINTYPQVQDIAVCGFCFGGKLAWLSGINPSVTKIISFYGTKPNQPYFNGKTVLDSLIKVRGGDSTLKTLAVFGLEDGSISEEDRDGVKKQLTMAGIEHKQLKYPAGHAFFSPDRPTFNSEVASMAWEEVCKFLDE